MPDWRAESGPDPVLPFRWNIAERSQLGKLIGTTSADRDAWLDFEGITANAYHWHSMFTYEWFLNELSLCAGRVIALCDNSDLCFVGRSPESLFDYLSGLLFDTSWAPRLTLLHFSWRDYYMSIEDLKEVHPGSLTELRKYLALLQLDPQGLAHRERPVAFVDIVVSGLTLGNLVRIIHNWCKDIGFDWSAVQRKIRIVGLTERTETSPKTWRWQQQTDWVEMLAPGTIKNVSIPVPLFHFFGGEQPKTTQSYIPLMWGEPQVAEPLHDEERLRALKIAAALFDDGRDKAQRLKFVTELSKQTAMRYAWFRSLVGEVKA